jgi:iron complex transport system permease protein
MLPFLMLAHTLSGQISLSFSEILSAFGSYDSNNTNHLIFFEFRIPRMAMAVLSGGALAVSGMLMQTLFNNPLAGPYVLGINSGASLVVALTLLTGIPFFTSDLGLITGALLGSFLFGSVILLFSVYVRSHISLLLIGLMISSFVGAVITTLESISAAEQLKSFTFWSFGSLQQTTFDQLPIILGSIGLGITGSFFLSKPLNAMVLGEVSAKTLGVPIRALRISVITITAVLTGTITAFCGPIAFVGLAIPNLTRMLFRTQNHQYLLIGNLLIGGIFMLTCDTIIQILEPYFVLPINALTSLIGAPFVVYIILKKLI